ncbi:MAG: hypothetical protein WCT04_13720 [Planctomycetota bacterium]
MTTAPHLSSDSTTASEPKPTGATPWIVLALWVAWLAALVAMSFPEWGKSKRNLIESNGRSDIRDMSPRLKDSAN